jgi:hypothetical protein
MHSLREPLVPTIRPDTAQSLIAPKISLAILGSLVFLAKEARVSRDFRLDSLIAMETNTFIAITITEGHEVGTTWTIGGDLGLGVDKVLGIDATLSASVSQTITDNTAEGVEYTCPDGKWTCSIMVYPGMKLVKGHLKKIEGNNEGCGVSPTDYGGDYEFKIPRKSEKGNEQSSVQLCVCGNLEGADDKGHPELKCAEDCVNPKGK